MPVDTVTGLNTQELEALRHAKILLEYPSLAARLSNRLGAPVENALARLPAGVHQRLQQVTHSALERGLDVALLSLTAAPPWSDST